MLGWVWLGLRTGVRTIAYPKRPEPQPEGMVSRLQVDWDRCRPQALAPCQAACPTGAIALDDQVLRLDLGRCIQCRRCLPACPQEALSFRPDYELAVRRREDLINEVVAP